MTFARPPKKNNSSSSAMQRSNTASQKPTHDYSGGGKGSGKGGGKGGGGNDRHNNSDNPSPWLDPENPPPTPHNEASFVEYLRWMRSPDSDNKDGTKLDLLSRAAFTNYDRYLTRREKQTKRLAKNGECFTVTCSWRVRVGGHRGPESILLPAFDAQGVPYIPSSTLRGVARAQAIRDVGENEAKKIFGALDAEKKDRAGKVVFFDAYPQQKQVGLSIDMANNIWSWDGNDLKYSPNPNPFFSLEQPTLTIGLRSASHSNDTDLAQVKKWLLAGLQAGIGSQVNSGYGEMLRPGQSAPTTEEFLRVKFELEGQLIHGRQDFTQWQWNDRRNEYQMRGRPHAEVRPIAFKNMLRYWFRVFARGVLPTENVQEIEGNLFGAIQPKRAWGWVKVDIRDGRILQREPRPNAQGKQDDCGEQAGTLILSPAAGLPNNRQDAVGRLMRSLTWMMFHLGGIGQGARRPCYSRKNRERAPWYRGSTLIPIDGGAFWQLPDNPQAFAGQFKQRLQTFYQALSQLTQQKLPNQARDLGQPRRDRWFEAADAHCMIVVCSGADRFEKPNALGVLHDQGLKIKDRRGNLDYDGDLCGQVQGGVKPSPVWVADMGDYQVVTVFGATVAPRSTYLSQLRQQSDRGQYFSIFPL